MAATRAGFFLRLGDEVLETLEAEVVLAWSLQEGEGSMGLEGRVRRWRWRGFEGSMQILLEGGAYCDGALAKFHADGTF